MDIHHAHELPDYLRKHFGKNRIKVLFFTDERYHRALHDAKATRDLSDFRFFIGSEGQLDVLLDRLLFYRFIERQKLAQVPKTISGELDPFSCLGDRILLRPRLSWLSLNSRQKVFIITSKSQLAEALNVYRAAGLTAADWCYQELLSVETRHNVSVSGWYGSDGAHLICTRKLLQHPEPAGNGDVIERILDPPDELMEQTFALLATLHYQGPLEVEWIFDRQTGCHKIIELNPRFWMQHELVNAITGHAVVGEYLGLGEPGMYQQMANPNLRYWVNSLYAIFRMLRGDIRGFRYALKKNSVLPLSYLQAAEYAPLHFLGKRSIA